MRNRACVGRVRFALRLWRLAGVRAVVVFDHDGGYLRQGRR